MDSKIINRHRILKNRGEKIKISDPPKTIKDALLFIIAHSPIEGERWKNGDTALYKTLFLLQKWSTLPTPNLHVIDNFGPDDAMTFKELSSLVKDGLLRKFDSAPFGKTEYELTYECIKYFRERFKEKDEEFKRLISSFHDTDTKHLIDISYNEAFELEPGKYDHTVSWELMMKKSCIIHYTLVHNLLRYSDKNYSEHMPKKLFGPNLTISTDKFKEIKVIETSDIKEFMRITPEQTGFNEDMKTFNSLIPLYLEAMNCMISIFNKAPCEKDLLQICFRKGFHKDETKRIGKKIRTLKEYQVNDSSRDYSQKIEGLKKEKGAHQNAIKDMPKLLKSALRYMVKMELIEPIEKSQREFEKEKSKIYFVPIKEYFDTNRNFYHLVSANIYKTISKKFIKKFPSLRTRINN